MPITTRSQFQFYQLSQYNQNGLHRLPGCLSPIVCAWLEPGGRQENDFNKQKKIAIESLCREKAATAAAAATAEFMTGHSQQERTM